MKETVKQWLNGLTAKDYKDYKESVLKLVDRYDKCLNVDGILRDRLKYIVLKFFQEIFN